MAWAIKSYVLNIETKGDSENYRAGIHVGFDDNARPYSVKETFKGKKIRSKPDFLR